MRFWIIIGLTLVLSAVGLTYEIAAGRVLAPYFGTSLLTWTAVIATVLAGFSLGSALGGFVAERPAPQAAARVRAALLATAILMAVSPTLLGFLHAGGARGTAGMMLSVVLTFFPASVFVTLPTPYLAKCAIEARPGRAGSSLGIVLAAGSVGAILGAILAGFIALPLIGSVATFAGCGLVTLACLPFVKGGDGRIGAPVIVAALGFIGFAGLAGSAVCDFESGQSCLHVVRSGDRISLYSDRTVQAAEPLGSNDGLTLPYTQVIWSRMERDLGPAPHVLFIGGGGYTLPTKLMADRPRATAVTVEIDPLVTQVVRRRLPRAGAMIARESADADGADGEARLDLVHADGRVYLNETKEGFDAAVMDAFSSSSVPAHLVTVETYARLREIVDGPVYVNLIGPPDGPLVTGVHAILAQLYPHVSAVQGPLSGRGYANVVLAASDRPLAAPGDLPDRYTAARIASGRAFTDDRGWVGHR
ncbi:spermidine synthase [Salipiger sp. IMCC34102]|uniref:fused MFS/spermidine synthase n=1 Tax=Salipiger sp. IMCC34102 TaxID=2510647 RepID=UPI00101DC866|nr:fused MFS/spermidine synthase [Salipiger sp. IMCC34102]RYH03042.1 spermidine synthase [Salipiger sp. IMCC34102]